METTKNHSPFRRTCQFCGLKSEAQVPESSNRRVRFMDSRGRMQNVREKTVVAMPAYQVNYLHERYECEKNPNRVEVGR